MNNSKHLASLSMDASAIQSKLDGLLEVLPESILDELRSMLFGLLSNVILVNGAAAIGAGSSLDVVYALDFDTAAYDKVLSAARTLKI
jgi:hypothetical protein